MLTFKYILVTIFYIIFTLCRSEQFKYTPSPWAKYIIYCSFLVVAVENYTEDNWNDQDYVNTVKKDILNNLSFTSMQTFIFVIKTKILFSFFSYDLQWELPSTKHGPKIRLNETNAVRLFWSTMLNATRPFWRVFLAAQKKYKKLL